MSRAVELTRRREQLIAACELQRRELALHVGSLGFPIRLMDRVLNVWAYLRRYPLPIGAAIAALAVTQRRGIFKWGQRALLVWRAWRAVRAGRKAF
jgi:hypothetical protein